MKRQPLTGQKGFDMSRRDGTFDTRPGVATRPSDEPAGGEGVVQKPFTAPFLPAIKRKGVDMKDPTYKKSWLKFYRALAHNRNWVRASFEAQAVFANALALSDDDGFFPLPKDLAFDMRKDERAVSAACDYWLQLGWFEQFDDGMYLAKHETYQADISTERVREHRARKRSGNVSETLRQRSGNVVEENRIDKEEEKSREDGEVSSTNVDSSPIKATTPLHKVKTHPDTLLVWNAWKELFNIHAKTELSDKRARRIRWALAKYQLKYVLSAIKGYSLDDWADRHTSLSKHDITLLLRDEEHVERGFDFLLKSGEDVSRLLPFETQLREKTSWQEIQRSEIVELLVGGQDAVSDMRLSLYHKTMTGRAYKNIVRAAVTYWHSGQEELLSGLQEYMRTAEDPGTTEVPEAWVEFFDAVDKRTREVAREGAR